LAPGHRSRSVPAPACRGLAAVLAMHRAARKIPAGASVHSCGIVAFTTMGVNALPLLSPLPELAGKKKPAEAGCLARRDRRVLHWCPRGDSNPYDSRRYHLKVVRLPIPPPGLKLAPASTRGALYALLG